MQWLVLRRRVSQAGWWVLATAVGFPMGLAVLFVVGRTMGVPIGLAVRSGGQGRCRRYGRDNAMACLESASLSSCLVGIGDSRGSAVGLPVMAVSVPVGGFVVGMITGAALIWFLRYPVPKPQ